MYNLGLFSMLAFLLYFLAHPKNMLLIAIVSTIVSFILTFIEDRWANMMRKLFPNSDIRTAYEALSW